MLNFNIIGSGQVGCALGYLFTQHTALTLNCVLSPTLRKARDACAFIGQGKPITDIHELTPADVYFITTPDQAIVETAKKLASMNILRPGNIVLHCSGALPASILEPLKSPSILIASIHPVKSFVEPLLSVQTFHGTFCGIEGDPEIYPTLNAWVTAIGGQAFFIHSSQKLIYHAALTMASNYLTALTEISLDCLKEAGIDRKTGHEILAPLMRQTLEQILTRSPVQALSGLIERGENEILAKEHLALAQWRPDIAAVYQCLGKKTVELAHTKGTNTEKLELIRQALEHTHPIGCLNTTHP